MIRGFDEHEFGSLRPFSSRVYIHYCYACFKVSWYLHLFRILQDKVFSRLLVALAVGCVFLERDIWKADAGGSGIRC